MSSTPVHNVKVNTDKDAERALAAAVHRIYGLGIEVQFGDVDVYLVPRREIPMDGSGMFDSRGRMPGMCKILLCQNMTFDRAVVTLAHELMHFWLYMRKKEVRAWDLIDPCVEEAVCELVGLAVAEGIPARQQIVDTQAWLVEWYCAQAGDPQGVLEALRFVREADDGRRQGSRLDTRQERAAFVEGCIERLAAMGV